MSICLLLLVCVACSEDPLKLTTVNLAVEAPEDGLSLLSISENEDWTYQDNLLVAKVDASIDLLPVHEDLSLSFSFRLTEGATATLWLQDRFPFTLPSVTATQPDGQPTVPLVNSTGGNSEVWQDVELVFVSPTSDTPPLLASVYLNGQLLYYQQPLAASSKTAGNLRLEAKAGEAAFTNFRYSSQAGARSFIDDQGVVSLQLPLLRYDYFTLPPGTKDVTNWTKMSP
ncbi:MAG: hypothetical protein AAFU03_12670, partial [Bacteroidota bacterium]